LPLLDGGEVCRRVRNVSPVPIIILTARNNETEKVSLLDVGADDYVTKPFSPAELLARIRVALRRNTAADETISGQMQAGEFTVDYDRRRVQRGSQEIRLTPKEFQLLSLFAQNPDRALTHREILRHIWGANAVDEPEHLWVLISQLRKKIEPDPSKPRYLVSEPWYGYRFVSEGQ
jgi:two-component system KDP operon response regulator KdpE